MMIGAKVKGVENIEAPRLFESAQTRLSAWPERTALQKLSVSLLALILLSGLICGGRVSPMIDNMSVTWEVVVFLWGALFGAYVLVATSNLPFSILFKVIALVGSGFSFVADGNALLEVYAFSGSNSQITQVSAPVIGSSECLGLKNSRPTVRAEPYPEKFISIKATPNICERFEPQKLDGHECVRLEVETGKYGIRRMLAPLSIGAC